MSKTKYDYKLVYIIQGEVVSTMCRDMKEVESMHEDIQVSEGEEGRSPIYLYLTYEGTLIDYNQKLNRSWTG